MCRRTKRCALWYCVGLPESGCGDAGRDAASGFVRLQRPGFLVNPVFTTVQRGSKVLPEINAPQVMGIGPELIYFSISQYKR